MDFGQAKQSLIGEDLGKVEVMVFLFFHEVKVSCAFAGRSDVVHLHMPSAYSPQSHHDWSACSRSHLGGPVMAFHSFPPGHSATANQPPQPPLYTPSPSPATAHRITSSIMTAPKNYTPTPAPYQAQHQLPPPPSPLPPPADPLEQRVLDLLYPYRDECFTEDEGKDESASLAKERMAHVLSGKLYDGARISAIIISGPQCFRRVDTVETGTFLIPCLRARKLIIC